MIMDTNGDNRMLLLKDLCGRLPYGVIVKDRNGVHKLTPGNTEFTDLFTGKVNIFPYLRQMSSMTDEECKEYLKLWDLQDEFHIDVFDWLNAHHFDYHGLIPMGLALETPDDMYK